MPEIQQRIRDSKPSPDELAGLDVDALVRRARRRTVVTRASAGVGTLAAVAAFGLVLTVLQPSGPISIDPVGPGDAVTDDSPTEAPVDAPVDTPADTPADTPTDTPTSSSDSSDAANEGTTGTGAEPPTTTEGEILASPTPGEISEPRPGGPSASACGSENLPAGIATVAIGPDVPTPRCLQVLPGQRLRIGNDTGRGDERPTGATVTAELGGFRVRVDPGEQVLLDQPVSNYLGAGVHTIESDFGPASADIWVLRAPSASLGQQAVIDSLVAFAAEPSDSTFTSLTLASDVQIGAGSEPPVERAADRLREVDAWDIGDGGSVLDVLADAATDGTSLVFTVGQRPACGGPMPEPPPAMVELTRLAVQSPPAADCDGWFAVDLYVDDDGTGEIHAVVLDGGSR